ncbi:MAG: hypothetical protein HGA63_06600, partial [Syntrophobacteraceae bacterium]|nr:hypothetical protein [Syntrophobacteraceae bacterium]
MERKNPARSLARLTEIIIDTIKETTSLQQQAITPGLLQHALSRRKDFLELLQAATASSYHDLGPRCASKEESSRASRPELNGSEPSVSTDGVLMKKAIQRLRDFRTSLLSESLDKLSNETLQQASALLEVVRSSADLDQLLDMNPEILHIL